jgi:hypothetical protein
MWLLLLDMVRCAIEFSFYSYAEIQQQQQQRSEAATILSKIDHLNTPSSNLNRLITADFFKIDHVIKLAD